MLDKNDGLGVQGKSSVATYVPNKMLNLTTQEAHDKIGTNTKSRSNDTAEATKPVQIIDKRSMDYIIRSGVAGGIAGTAAKTLVAPLDRIKILFQTSNPEFLKYRGSYSGFFRAGKLIWKGDGLYGLYQGHSVTLLRIFPYAAIKFVAYEQVRSILIPNDKSETSIRRFMAGSLSGLLSVYFTYPLDVIRVRMAFETRNLSHHNHDHAQYMEHHKGRLFATIKTIYNESPPHRASDPGWLKFMRKISPPSLHSLSNYYRGFAPTILGMIPYAGVSFYTHDSIHDIFRSKYFYKYTVQPTATNKSPEASAKIIKTSKYKKDEYNSRDTRAPLKAYAQLIAGGVAGMCSQTAAYPFEVIRRRMQVGGAVNQGQFLSFKNTAKLIFKEGGIRGFFVGLTIGYIKVIPMGACSFFVYERCKRMFGI